METVLDRVLCLCCLLLCSMFSLTRLSARAVNGGERDEAPSVGQSEVAGSTAIGALSYVEGS